MKKDSITLDVSKMSLSTEVAIREKEMSVKGGEIMYHLGGRALRGGV